MKHEAHIVAMNYVTTIIATTCMHGCPNPWELCYPKILLFVFGGFSPHDAFAWDKHKLDPTVPTPSIAKRKVFYQTLLIVFELYAFLIQESTQHYLAYINWPFIFSCVLFLVNLSMCLTMNTMAWLIYNKCIWPFKSSTHIYLTFHMNE